MTSAAAAAAAESVERGERVIREDWRMTMRRRTRKTIAVAPAPAPASDGETGAAPRGRPPRVSPSGVAKKRKVVDDSVVAVDVVVAAAAAVDDYYSGLGRQNQAAEGRKQPKGTGSGERRAGRRRKGEKGEVPAAAATTTKGRLRLLRSPGVPGPSARWEGVRLRPSQNPST
jgi:hypothetical protein